MTVCSLCFHRCDLSEGKQGICRARRCVNGVIMEENAGLITSLALDPVEKKPFRHFYPGTKALSLGSFGCNLRCPFCQNHQISMSNGTDLRLYRVSPEFLLRKALELKPQGNIGLAYTYNEPTLSFNFIKECASLIHAAGMKNLLVTNGSLNSEPLEILLPYIDAMNVDLKGFTQEFYSKLGGDLETVKAFIAQAIKARCHVEITTLVIPGENDSEEEIDAIARWLAGFNSSIPLHLSRFFPRYRWNDRPATPVADIYRLAQVARRHLKNVYEGNC